MNKRHHDMLNELHGLGYAYDRTNSKGLDFYIHEDTGCELKVPGGTTEGIVRTVLRVARQQIGLPTKGNKRNPQQIRERNAVEHARAKAELDRIRAERDIYATDEARLRQLEDQYLRAERKFRYWDRLMREVVSA